MLIRMVFTVHIIIQKQLHIFAMHVWFLMVLKFLKLIFLHSILLVLKPLKDFPSLKFIIPHGGGAAPYHWGRYRGIALDMNLGELNDRIMKNVYFDTCVYHQPGIDLLLKVIPSENVLFASETIGAVRAVNPETGISFDNTHEYIKATQVVNDVEKQKIYSNC